MKTKNTTRIMLAVMTIGLAVYAMTLLGCGRVSSLKGENFNKDGSYVIGTQFGQALASDGIVPDMNELIKGMTDAILGKELRFSDEEASFILQNAYEAMASAREESFLAENRKNPDIQETSSGLQYEVLVEGSGPKPGPSDTVQVHFEGRFVNGTVFGSSYQYGSPLEFHLTSMVPGFSEGLQLMSVGSTYRLFIPSELGYGSAGNEMPPYATLIFEIELLDILEL